MDAPAHAAPGSRAAPPRSGAARRRREATLIIAKTARAAKGMPLPVQGHEEKGRDITMQMPQSSARRGTIAMDWHADDHDNPVAHFEIKGTNGQSLSFDMDRGEVHNMMRDMAQLLLEMDMHVTPWVVVYDPQQERVHVMDKTLLRDPAKATTLCGTQPAEDDSWEMRPMQEDDAPTGEERDVCQVCVSLYLAQKDERARARSQPSRPIKARGKGKK